MRVLDSIEEGLGGQPPADDVSVHSHCEFCDSEFDTAYSSCPDCGSEHIQDTN
jgi:predicted Zn-ribbon and HTH transcriptional regulator